MSFVPPRTTVVLPTAFDVVLVANENIIQNLLLGQPSTIQLPSLYRRAYQIVNGTDEMLLVKQNNEKK